MKPEQISTWIGIATAFAGVVASFVTMEARLEALSAKMDEMYNIEEIRAMEKRLVTLEVTQSNSSVGALSATIATMKSEIKNVEKRMEAIQGESIAEIKDSLGDNKSGIQNLKTSLAEVQASIRNTREKLNRLADSSRSPL
jgi:chromosome segregation ATPase